MNRTVWVHGGLLGIALLAAYFVWTREPTTVSEDEVQIVNLRGDLDRVVYASDERTVEINQRKDDRGLYHWVRVETWETPPPKPKAPVPPPNTNSVPTRPGEVGKPAMQNSAPMRKMDSPIAVPKPGVAPTKEVKKAVGDKAVGDKESLRQDPKANLDQDQLSSRTDKSKSAVEPAKRLEAAPSPAASRLSGQGNAASPTIKAGQKPESNTPVNTTALKQEIKPEPKVRKVQEFTGNKSTEELMKNLSTLTSLRALGKVDADKLKAFGLTDTKKSLTLVSNSIPRVFLIGGNTYGNMDVYIQDKEDGRVYVVHPKSLQDFQYAEFRLMERNLHSFDQSDIERAVVTLKNGKKTLVQQNRKEPTNAYWADENTPNKKQVFYRNWINKVFRINILEYVAPSKKLEGLNPILTIEYFSGSRKLGSMQLFKQESTKPPAGGNPADLTAGGDYFVQSETTRQFAKISRAFGDELSRDIPNLLKE